MLSILSPFKTGFRSNLKRQEITLQGVNHQMDGNSNFDKNVPDVMRE